MQEQSKQELKNGMGALDKIRYWAKLAQEELSCFVNIEASINKVLMLAEAGMLWIEEIENKGVIAFLITDDFRGQIMCSELFFYVKPEHRGNIRLFKSLIDLMEKRAKQRSCQYVNFGSNIGYRDEKLLGLLARFGYKTDTVKKEI